MHPSRRSATSRWHVTLTVLPTVLAVLVVSAAGAAATPSAAETAPPEDRATRPNIVFILADDLGYTDLGVQGSQYYLTPHLDRLAAGGLRFRHGYSAGPNCQPTRAALISGQYGPRTGVYTVGSIERFPWRTRPLRPVDNVVALPQSIVTLPQALKAAGYATALFGKWHLGDDGDAHPARRGFDEAIVSAGRHFDFATRPPVPRDEGTYLADFLTDRAVDFVQRHRAQPFFLCLHHFAVHSPLQAKTNLIHRFRNRPTAGGHTNAVYAAMIASLDESVGRVMAALREASLTDRTLVIFTSDNGGVGGYAREGIPDRGATDNAPLRGGKGMLYEGGIRVPWIFHWPGTVRAGQTSDVPITSVDLFPTLLELSGAPAPAGQVLDGISLAGLLRAGPGNAPVRPALFWHFPGYLGSGGGTWRTTPAGAIRSGDWKLVEFFEDGRLELYHLRDDPGEQRNLAHDQPDVANGLALRLAQWRQEVGAPMPTRRIPSVTRP